MDPYAVAAQLYTLRDYTKTPAQIEKTLRRVKDTGFHAVQVSGIGPVDPAELKRMADANGLKICATHIAYDDLQNNLDALIRKHLLWNCRYVGLGSMPMAFRGSADGYRAFIQSMSKPAMKIHQSGLHFIYHNHHFEFEKFDGKTGLEIIFDNTDPESFGMEIDTYWVQAGGANPVDWIRKVRGRMDVVHFKDMAIKNGTQIFAEIGQGNLDWDAIIGACRETGVKWYSIEQDVCPGDPFDSLETSLRYLLEKCGGGSRQKEA